MITLKRYCEIHSRRKLDCASFEKMLYDNVQFILLLSKYCKINPKFILEKIRANNRIFKINFLNRDGFLGSAFDADSEGEEGKYYVFTYDEVKRLKNIEIILKFHLMVIGEIKLY